MSLHAVPLAIKEANARVDAWHRHLDPAHHALWAVGACLGDGRLVGAAIVGLPTARLDAERDPFLLQVVRCATDGTPNANSFLHAACWRIARAQGARRLVTLSLPSEGGGSYRELCGKVEETRPYGPNGERVCFECGMKDEAAAERGFRKHVLGEEENA